MCKLAYEHNCIIEILKNSSSLAIINLLLQFCVGLCLLVILSSCTSTIQSDNQSATQIPSIFQDRTADISLTPKTTIQEGTISPVYSAETEPPPLSNEPIDISSKTPQPDLGTEVINVTATSTPEIPRINGQLFIYDPIGIQVLSFADNGREYLLKVKDEWIDWGASFAQNKKYLAFWTKSVNGTELWFTSLPDWHPSLLFTLNDVEFDFITLLWGVNDRYLLLNLSILDNSGSYEDIKTLRTYIVDTKTMRLVNESYWSGDCSTLARSPQTSQLSLWCHQVQEQEGSQQFLVLEPAENPWTTQQVPDSLMEDCLIFAKCDWSQDGQLVAYVIMDFPESLFYALVDNPVPIGLDDKRTDVYSFLLWSPNSQFLYYTGACVDGGIQNPNVMSVTDQKIVWCVEDKSNQGEYGHISVSRVSWSPDSRYLALPISPNIEEEILIFDISTQQELSRVSDLDSIILDMVWVDN